MARIKLVGVDSYIEKMTALGRDYDRVTDRALFEAAKIVADKAKANLNAVTAGDATGDLAASMGIAPIRREGDGKSLKIGFDGYDRKGTPNQLKANVLERGSSKQRAKPFMRPAVAATKQQALAKMQEVIDEETAELLK